MLRTVRPRDTREGVRGEAPITTYLRIFTRTICHRPPKPIPRISQLSGDRHPIPIIGCLAALS